MAKPTTTGSTSPPLSEAGGSGCRDDLRLLSVVIPARNEEEAIPSTVEHLHVELPLKAIVRGFRWTVIPITWRNRRSGVAKLRIREMGSRHFFICAYVWLEKYLSRGDCRTSRPE